MTWQVLALVTLALFAVASFVPDVRLWGIHHLSYYPVPVRVLALAVVSLALIPRCLTVCLEAARAVTRLLAPRRWLTASLAAVLFLALCRAFPSATLLFGDGNFVATIVRDGAQADGAAFLASLRHPHPAFAGTDALYEVGGRFAARTLGLDALEAVRVVAALVGAALAFALVAWLLGPGRPAIEDRLVALLAATSGAVALFFGYIEVYAPFLGLAVLYVVTARAVLRRRASMWRPMACVMAACGMHALGLLLLPSFAMLAAWVARGRPTPSRLVVASRWLVIALLPLPWVAREVTRLENFVRPLFGAGGTLSPGHLADVANELLLICPALIVAGGCAVVAMLRSRGSSENRPTFTGMERAFALLLVVPMLLFLFAFRSDLGMARDWDLFAFSGLAVLGLVWYALRAAAPTAVASVVSSGTMVWMVIFTATMTTAWIGVHASEERALARYRTIMLRDVVDPGYAWEQLAAYYREREDIDQEIASLEQAVAVSPNPRYRFTLGLRYFSVGEKEKAILQLERALRSRPEYTRAREFLIQMLGFAGRTQEIVAVCDEGIRIEPSNPFFYFMKGYALAKLGAHAEAIATLNEARLHAPPPEMAAEIGKLLAALGAPPSR